MGADTWSTIGEITMPEKKIKIDCNLTPDVEDALNMETPSITHRQQSVEPIKKGDKNDGNEKEPR